MQEQLSTHVALATLALLCYRLLFHSQREASLTAMLFCAACAWCAGQMAAAAAGAQQGVHFAVPAAAAAAAARTACSSVLFSASAREACWNYTAYFLPPETQ